MSQDVIDFNQLRDAAGEATDLLRSLANADRLMLLCQLSQGEFCVGELEQATGIQQPTLSQQLGILRRHALVSTRREGKQIYYRLANEQAERVLHTLYELYCQTHCREPA